MERLRSDTREGRDYLLGSPIIRRCFAGDVTLADYVAFLTQAYHHVKHTVPLLMAVGARLSEDREWLREAVAEYIGEEMGHQEWILDDIAACGHDRDAARASRPSPATELMVAYAWDTVQRVDPIGFFGMVHVLEGTSMSTADGAADAIRDALGLPERAFRYLRSHGALDVAHCAFFENLMNRIEDRAEQDRIVHSATMFYRLYADIFRTLTPAVAMAA
jgi:pyrroloquinoline quinone (PQQ) biosynthesis protein C